MLTTGEAIGVLKAIEYKVWEYDIPSPGCPEYREHHEACQDILKYIRGYIDLIKKYDGIPGIQDMYPTIHVTMWEDTDAVPTDPDNPDSPLWSDYEPTEDDIPDDGVKFSEQDLPFPDVEDLEAASDLLGGDE